MQSTNKNSYGCLFCRSGQEEATANELRTLYPEIEYIVPLKKRYRRIGKVLQEETVTLFSGYIFFRTNTSEQLSRLESHRNVFRILKDTEHNWQLQGSDLTLVENLFNEDGIIGFSKARFENEQIVIVDGFLKDKNFDVVCVNHRARTLQVRLSLAENVIQAWVGYILE